jgi:uncharacterized damage-inducible protein DinB
MRIRTIALRAAVLLALAATAVLPGRAGDAKTSGFQADYISQINQVEKQILDLEGAVPQEKFGWRPAEGVRSISEVYSHIAFGNYIILKLAGYDPPAEANFVPDPKKWESQTSDKAKIADLIRASFDNVRAIATKVTDAELEKKVNVFGSDMTLRAAMMVNLSHLHEHLGQSIAYARSNGVVPPWTAAQQKAEQSTMKK